MKHFLTLLITFGALSYAYGQNGQGISNTPADSINIQILNELKSIHQFQIDEQTQRKKDIDEWRGQGDKKIQEESPSDIGMMAKIEGNTRQHPLRDGWNLYGWIAFLVAAFSAIVALITFRAQSKTEQHTKNAPLSAQIGRLKDLTRHLYRNLVCTSAAIAKFNSSNNYDSTDSAKKKEAKEIDGKNATEEGLSRVSYPSESNFNKLKTMPDDVVLNIDVNERTYAQMHELKVLLRNYNIEIDVASSHSSNKQILDKTLEQDFDNLLFKPLHLIKSAFESEELMLSTESGNLPLPDRSVYIIMEEHFKKLKTNLKALGYNDSFEVLKDFFGEQSDVTNLEDFAKTVSERVKKFYLSKVDVTNALNRAIDGFIIEAKKYNSALFDSEKGTLTISCNAFCEYLNERDDQILKDIQGRLKENRKLLKKTKRSLLWPVEIGRKKDEIKLISASVSKLENKLKKEKKKKTEEKLSYFVSQVAQFGELETFKKYVKYDENDKPHVSIEDLHKQIYFYNKYIALKEWDFKDLIYVILAIDSAIEVNRRGMVNYA